jgi:hypothetical protein
MADSIRVRSRIIGCALTGSFQKSGRSERAFSSARRFSATPQSKTPPEQADGLPDRLNHVLEFRSHRLLSAARNAAFGGQRLVVAVLECQFFLRLGRINRLTGVGGVAGRHGVRSRRRNYLTIARSGR